MEANDFTVTIGTITYTEFPTYAEICLLRSDVITQLLVFFRMIGLCSTRQINRAIGNDENDHQIRQTMQRVGVSEQVDESCAAENMAYTEKEIQRGILGNDTKHYTVRITDIISKLHKLSTHTPQKALAEILDELRGIIKKVERKEKKMEEKVVEPGIIEQPTSASEAPAPTTALSEEGQKVWRIATECPIKPVRDVAKVRKDKGYLEQLVGYFPHSTASLIAKYLFNEMAKISTVNNMFYLAKITREKGGDWRHPSLDVVHERAAFVAWAGGDWREYLAENLPLDEIKPAKPTPAPVKEPEAKEEPEWNAIGDNLDLEPATVTQSETGSEPTDEPVKVEPKKPVPAKAKPAKKPAPTPAEPKPVFVAEIKISATNPEILRILSLIEQDTTAELIEYCVTK